MKLNQNDLVKLAIGAGAGYIGSYFLIPHRGFAGGYPSWNGHDCRHITNDMIKNMSRDDQQKWIHDCNLDFKQSDDLWRHATSDPHGALIGLPWQTASDASSWPAGGGGGGGGDWGKNLSDAVNSSVNWLRGNVGMPVLIGGGLVLAILLASK